MSHSTFYRHSNANGDIRQSQKTAEDRPTIHVPSQATINLFLCIVTLKKQITIPTNNGNQKSLGLQMDGSSVEGMNAAKRWSRLDIYTSESFLPKDSQADTRPMGVTPSYRAVLQES